MKSITHGLVFGWVSMGRPTTWATIAALKKNKIENVIWTMLIKSCMRAINAVRRRRSTQKVTGNSILWIVVGGECRNQPNKARWSSRVFIRNLNFKNVTQARTQLQCPSESPFLSVIFKIRALSAHLSWSWSWSVMCRYGRPQVYTIAHMLRIMFLFISSHSKKTISMISFCDALTFPSSIDLLRLINYSCRIICFFRANPVLTIYTQQGEHHASDW